VTQYYLNGTVNSQQLYATPSGFSPITDTSFPAQIISGFLQVNGNTSSFGGYFGSGTFNTTLSCSASQGILRCLVTLQILASKHVDQSTLEFLVVSSVFRFL
jgi:hypothetical protein